jgi:hypothetical protein
MCLDSFVLRRRLLYIQRPRVNVLYEELLSDMVLVLNTLSVKKKSVLKILMYVF